VMVWIAGDNNLQDFGDLDIKEMQKVGSSDDLQIIVQYDRMSDHQTKRFEILPGRSVEVADLGETNTGDPAIAADFLTWGIQTYPADRFLAVLWNHGSGLDEADIYHDRRTRGLPIRGKIPGSAPSPRALHKVLGSNFRRSLFSSTAQKAIKSRAIAYDDTAKDFLDNTELKKVLDLVKIRTGRGLDVLGCDACLMNMIEIAYQLKDNAAVLVGSEEVEPGEGWPYDRVLQALADKPTMSPQEAGQAIVDAYRSFYKKTSEQVTQSALDLGQASAVGIAVSSLSKALIAGMKNDAEFGRIMLAVNKAQRFEIPDFVDLGDFCAKLKEKVKSADIKKAADVVLGKLAPGGFVLKNTHQGSGVKGATGVSIFVPVRGGQARVAYSKLEFARRHDWDDFITVWSRKSGLTPPRSETLSARSPETRTTSLLPYR